MKIIILLDYSSTTEQLLATTKTFIGSLKSAEITVLHVIDERLFYATTGFEVRLDEEINDESTHLKELCTQYLGPNVNYIEEFGIPKLKINETLDQINYDLAIAGSHSRHKLSDRFVGSIAEYLLHNSKSPVLIIP